ncbi:MAG: phosphomannomutase [Thaumarchaeota archaeon]|nr:phosphomannomutase [Nitrososphaerota archaeon]
MKISISGIRGIFGNDFTQRDVLKFCNSFSVLVKSKKCVIGTDTRPSSHIIKETAAAALMQCGIDVFNLGMVPTPVVFRESRKYGAGIVVTSSHNPIEWNGLKFTVDGRGINEDELKLVASEQITSKAKIGTENLIDSSYVDDAAKLIGKISDMPKTTIDIGGGAARNVAPLLLKKLGCNVKTINEDIGKSTRGPDPTTDNLNTLISNTGNKDIGFAFDLDADRLVVVYGGKKQSSDVTLGLGVAKALELGYKKFVFSIDTSVAIEKFVRQNGGTVQRSKVGEANVIDLMLKTKAQAGGEGSSAGFILPEFNFCRDGLLASGFIASMLGTSAFNEILKFMSNYHQNRDKIAIKADLHDKTISKLYENIKGRFSEIITIDGIKAIIDEDSWVLVRKSNTEDTIRISSESNNLKRSQEIKNEVLDLVKKSHEQIK